MKKLVSLLLLICTICPLLISCDVDDNEQMKKDFLSFYGEEGMTVDDVIIEFDAGVYNDTRIVMLDAGKHEQYEHVVTYGDNISFTYYDTNVIYAYKFGFFFPLDMALAFDFITEEHMELIAFKYNQTITCYDDVLDDYDYDKCEIDLSLYKTYDPNLQTNVVLVSIDKRLIDGTKIADQQRLVDYVNSSVGSNIVRSIGNNVYGDAQSTTYKVFIEDRGVEGLLEIINQLSKVPGIVKIECYNRSHHTRF